MFEKQVVHLIEVGLQRLILRTLLRKLALGLGAFGFTVGLLLRDLRSPIEDQQRDE